MKKIIGCGTALITPFKKDFSVDYAAFRKLVQRQIAAKVHFLVPLGTTGEAPCLDDAEKVKLLDIAVEEVNGKFPVVAGAGSNCTRHVIHNMDLLAKTGIDAFLIATPYYNKPTQSGLYNHYKTIAAATNKPIIMYNVPGRTAVNMNAETCLKLAEIPNIIATKEASGNYAQISEIIRNAPRNFAVLSGNDDETLALMATGAQGVISVVANLVPQEMTQLVNYLLQNKINVARKLHHKLAPIFKNCFIETNPIPVKAGLYQMRLIANVLRPPLYPATENTLKIMAKIIKSL
jgi:4-hydroxy-tetrahydrodipicolinate synthase